MTSNTAAMAGGGATEKIALLKVLGPVQVAARDRQEAFLGHPAEELVAVEELDAVIEAVELPPVT